MVEIEFSIGEFPAAVLTGMLVANKEVFAGKFHLLHGEAIIMVQKNDLRHPQPPPDGADELAVIFGRMHDGELDPLVKFENEKLIIIRI